MKWSVFLLFIISGICGLIYEVAWSKYLALFIGSTTYAHTIVLATYMGGLAVGAFFFGKYADKVVNQLKLYGWMELGVGAYCLFYPFIADAMGDLFVYISSLIGRDGNPSVMLLLKFLLSFVTLIVPTILMGGTLPVLLKSISKRLSDSAKDIALLYAINSLGAVIGTALAGFFLIRTYGLQVTVWMAALINLLIGVIAIYLSKYTDSNYDSKHKKPVEELSLPFFSSWEIRIVIITAFLSGFIAMIYELTWIRLLSNVLGSTTYSFTLMLIAFIGGISLGGFLVSVIIKRIKNLMALLSLCQLGTVFSMLIILPLYERLPYYLLQLSTTTPNVPEKFGSFLFLELMLCFLIMFFPTLFSGMSLPVVSRMATRELKFLGNATGTVFSINTIGSVLGAVATGLFFIPFWGVKSSLELAVCLNALIGIILLVKANLSKQIKIGLTSLGLILMIVYQLLSPSWNDNYFISGVFRTLYTKGLPSYQEFRELQTQGQKIIWYKEGVDANVAVRESVVDGEIQKTLVINGKADASTVADLHTQILLGQIPLMFYPNSGDAMVIGLGSGITCGSILCHPVNSLDVVEIAAEVVECNNLFEKENRYFNRDPRVKIYVDDAITQLRIASKKYDYIISEPSNPWIAGIGNLYSIEFFELCKTRLKPNGVLTQWFHTYDVNDEVFKLVLSTINRVFAHVSIWKASDSDLIILASSSPQVLNIEEMEHKMHQQPTIKNDLARINIHDVPTLLSTQIVSCRNNPFFSTQNKVNTTDKSPLEFLAPITLFTHTSLSVLDSLDERFAFQDKNLWLSTYQQERQLTFENYLNMARYRNSIHVGDVAFAYTALRKAQDWNPQNEEVQTLMTRMASLLRIHDWTIRKAHLDKIRLQSELHSNDLSVLFNYLNELVEYYRIDNSIVNPQSMDEAVVLLKKMIQVSTSRVETAQIQYILSMVLTGAGRYVEAAESFKILKNQNSETAIWPEKEILFNIAESYFNAGNMSDSEVYIRQIRTIDPQHELSLNLLRKIDLKKSGVR